MPTLTYDTTQSLYKAYTEALLLQAKQKTKSKIIDPKQTFIKMWLWSYAWPIDSSFTNDSIDELVYWCSKISWK